MRRIGNQTFIFDKPPFIIGASAVAGPKEAKGNFGDYFDLNLKDDAFGEKSYEKAECKMQKTAMESAVEKARLTFEDIDAILSGDISNQITASSFAARGHNSMYLGLYGACATFGEAAILGGMLICGGFMNRVLCAASSHFSSAERQYRYPLELGNQRPPSSQWTVTAAGAIVLSVNGDGPRLTGGTVGKIVDMGVTDANNMGAAMAPAACECIYAHFKETGRAPDYYDLILTGDLGKFGHSLLLRLLKEKGVDMPESFNDCGAMIYKDGQEAFQGGSGAGCCGAVFSSFIYKQMSAGRLGRVLIVPTGALLSKTSAEQGESIPGIAHAFSVENP
ncbi:MAG: stage V sporulation protein AD [Clostridiales bacterium]|jgi:stage V sporulation protein AD|nr:stage V sporulation protein AD [Clostridiales bacterium]